MNIVKVNYVVDLNFVNDFNELFVVVFLLIVNVLRSVLQDFQDEIFNLVFVVVDLVGNRFLSFQLWYLFGQVCFELCMRNLDIEVVCFIIEGYGYVCIISFCFLKLFFMFMKWLVGYIFYVFFRNVYFDQNV